TYTPGLPFGSGKGDQPGLAHVGRVFTLSADAPPQRALTLTLIYEEDELGPAPEATLGLYRWNEVEQVWEAQPNTHFDAEANQIVAQIDRLGAFALLGTPWRAYLPMALREEQQIDRPITCHNLAANGGFESGPPGVPWQMRAASNDPLIYQSARRSGAWGLWLGARTTYTDTAWQRIELPRQALTATLTLWWRMSTNETSATTVYDVARFGLQNAAGGWVGTPISVTNLATRNTWVSTTLQVNVSTQAGQAVSLTLTSSNDYSKITSWFVDDVTVNVCAPQSGWGRPASVDR
ncbi:MAG: hypothetical protein RMN25_12850, partial [Anaerolineae bacterium]|nr:hypothetical protein [Thermoflexales bacterium]MDW8408661.1 hypothetical protein [Anaerolineae bacterium]